MPLTLPETIAILLCIIAGTACTRFLPFILFPESKTQPKIISYLSTTIPAAMMGLLVVYCLRNTSVAAWPYGLPEFLATAITVILHLWRRNILLSIAAGTLSYMFFIQLIFT